MIGLLLIATLKSVVVGDISDCGLLVRFLALNRVDSARTNNLESRVWIHCTEPEASKLLTRFSDEFGVMYLPGWPAVEKKPCWKIYTLRAAQDIKGSPWPQMAPDSLFMKAYRQVAAKEKGDYINCQYWIRPWITEGLKRTETVEGKFVVRQHGRTREVLFWSEP